MGAAVGLLGPGQGVLCCGQRLHGHVGGCGRIGWADSGHGHGRGGLAAPEKALAHQQHGGKGQRGRTCTAQQPCAAALACPQAGACGKGVVGAVPAQAAVMLGHGGRPP